MSDRCPTCGNRFAQWTRPKIIAAIQAFHAEHGRPPAAHEWAASAAHHPAKSTVTKMFNSWSAGIREAGYQPHRSGGKLYGGWTQAKMVAAFYQWTYEHGRQPGMRDWDERDVTAARPTSTQAVRMFGSWNAFVVAAGYEPLVNHHSRRAYRATAHNTKVARRQKGLAA